MRLIVMLFLLPFQIMATTYIGIIGDSISVGAYATDFEGYVQMLQKRYVEEEKDVILLSRSFGGAKVDSGYPRIYDLMLHEKPKYIVVALGINDIGANTNPLYLYEQFDAMCICAQKYEAKFLIGSVDAFLHNPIYNNHLANCYNHLVIDLKAQLWKFLTADIIINHTIDTLHPDDIGHKIIADELYRQLEIAGVK